MTGRHRPTVHGAIGPAVRVIALGPVAGVVWWLLAPSGAVALGPDFVVPIGTSSAGPPSDVFAAGQDAVFAVVVLVSGALCGIATCIRMPAGRATLVRWVTAVLSGLVAAVLAWSLGMVLGPDSLAAQEAAGADPLVSPLRLSSPAPLLMWPMATCLVAFVVSLVSLLVDPPGDA